LLDESKGFDGSTNSFLRALVLVSLLDGLGSGFEDHSSVISLVDAHQKILEVEGSNLGGGKESGSNLGGHFSVNVSKLWVSLEFFSGSSGVVKDLTNSFTISVVIFVFVSMNSLLSLNKNWESVDKNILGNWLEESDWVLHHFESAGETVVVP